MATFTNLMQLTELGEDRFEAPIAPETSDRMFGGQFLAQCLRAAQATLEVLTAQYEELIGIAWEIFLPRLDLSDSWLANESLCQP